MKTLTYYICEICESRYISPSLAQACESSGIPPEPKVEIGKTVKLKNRSGYSYTEVNLKELRIAPGRLNEWLSSRPEENIGDMDLKKISWHQWELILDEPVYLDHAWESSMREVSESYLVPEDKAKSMRRMDNHSD